ncbi:MAG: Crp/Fnr family transcriptional regulator [Xanthomonadales bacterium]|nr:Crp/Fnr family transcriptional regulator [Xanthomonadales bacterium]
MADDTIRNELGRNEFFRRFPDEYLDFLAEQASECEFKQGEMVFRQGDRADRFFLLLSGNVNVSVPAILGPTLVIQELGPGKILGWSWLISPYQWDFQAEAMSDAKLIQFEGGPVLKHCEEDNEFGYALLKRFTELMSERLHAGRRRMMEQWNPAGFA